MARKETILADEEKREELPAAFGRLFDHGASVAGGRGTRDSGLLLDGRERYRSDRDAPSCSGRRKEVAGRSLRFLVSLVVWSRLESSVGENGRDDIGRDTVTARHA
jgi:hypothetical protein